MVLIVLTGSFPNTKNNFSIGNSVANPEFLDDQPFLGSFSRKTVKSEKIMDERRGASQCYSPGLDIKYITLNIL